MKFVQVKIDQGILLPENHILLSSNGLAIWHSLTDVRLIILALYSITLTYNIKTSTIRARKTGALGLNLL